MKCVSDCRHPWWGGDGFSAVSADGGCICSCDKGTTSFNVFGEPACEPKALLWSLCLTVIILAVATIGHGAWNSLRRCDIAHLRSRARFMSAENLRRRLHAVAVVQGLVYALYYTLMIIFGEYENGAACVRWLSLGMVPMGGASIASAMTTAEMWLATYDRRLVREAKLMTRLTTSMSTTVGMKFLAWSVLTMPSLGVTLLILTHRPDAAKRVGMVGFVASSWLFLSVIVCCCWSLMKAITQQQQRTNLGHTGQLYLVGARKKILRGVGFMLHVGFNGVAAACVVCFTGFGLATPALFCLVPTSVLPLAWTIFNERQLAGAKTRRGLAGIRRSSRASMIVPHGRPSSTTGRHSYRSPMSSGSDSSENLSGTSEYSLEGHTSQRAKKHFTRSRMAMLQGRSTQGLLSRGSTRGAAVEAVSTSKYLMCSLATIVETSPLDTAIIHNGVDGHGRNGEKDPRDFEKGSSRSVLTWEETVVSRRSRIFCALERGKGSWFRRQTFAVAPGLAQEAPQHMSQPLPPIRVSPKRREHEAHVG